MNYRPIFIAGCDRSGTTLLGDLIGAGRWAIATPESQFVHELMIHFGLGTFTSTDAAAAWLLDHFRFAAWGLRLDRRSLAEQIRIDEPRTTVENLLACYAHQVHPGKRGADVWVDHTPDSFKYQSMLKQLFPEARFIHIVRDGRGVCASLKALDWGPNNAYTASRHWAARLQEALAVEVAEAENCLRVRYEDLLQESEPVLRRICRFIDVPFEPDLSSGGGVALPAFTRTQHRRVGGPLEPSRADAWRRTLTRAEIRDFESYPLSHTLLSRMGYQPFFEKPPRLSSARVFGRYCHDFVHYLANRWRHRAMEAHTVAAHRASLERSTHDGREAPAL